MMLDVVSTVTEESGDSADSTIKYDNSCYRNKRMQRKTHKMTDDNSIRLPSKISKSSNIPAFKAAFKYYKGKAPSPDLSSVLDFSNFTGMNVVEKNVGIDGHERQVVVRNQLVPGNNESEAYHNTLLRKEDSSGSFPGNGDKIYLKSKIQKVCIRQDEALSSMLGLHHPCKWNVFSHSDRPGMFFICNPFKDGYQNYWVRRCLADYHRHPHKTNFKRPDMAHKLWSKFAQKSDVDDFLKLRWATVGYQHNWDTKKYSKEEYSEFPADLAELSCCVSKILGFDSFRAEAAIINYYQLNSTLAGHTDHSEMNMEAPLLSFSFGQSAVFLLGSSSLEEEPTAMYLRSGDIVVLSGSSRLAYHAVPKIVPNSYSPKAMSSPESNKSESSADPCDLSCDWAPYERYLETSRINMNVRQVLGNGHNF